jgi:hypothetical protein
MIEPKEIPSEYVSIRQVWLRNVNRCCEAISNRAKPDGSETAGFHEVGNRTVVHTIRAFYYTLVDYGEALVKTDVDEFLYDVIEPQLENIKSWEKSARIHQRLFEKIIEVLNKYGMLFETQPKGYSNVEMSSVQ